MSENYKTEDKNKITILDVLLVAMAVLVSIPILPFCLAYIFLILKTNRRENYVLFPCIALIVLLISKMQIFLTETINIVIALIKGIANHKFAILAYSDYSFSSWVLLTAISLVIASCVVKRIRHNYKLEEVGVNSLSRKYRENGGKSYEYSY